MKQFEFRWEAKVQRSVLIEAETEEEAFDKWINGEYDEVNTDDEDMTDDYVELDGKAYYNDRFEEVKFGN